MSETLPPRTSAAKAGWLIGLLFAAWLIFLLGPRLREPEAPEPTPVPARTPTRLAALGLEDISDLEQVPEMFAIWATFGEWHDNRTKFAYWSPGAQDFVYNIEARRTPDGYRFRMIRQPEDLLLDEEFAPDCPLRFYRSASPEYGRVNRSTYGRAVRTPSTPPKSVPVTMPLPSPSVAPVDIKVDLTKPPAKK